MNLHPSTIKLIDGLKGMGLGMNQGSTIFSRKTDGGVMFMTQTIGQVELEYVALSEQNQYLVVRTLEKTQSSSNVFYH